MKDVQSVAPLIGAKPTVKLPNGGDMYTVPIIYDPSTKQVISDSLPIIEYLEATYPAVPTLIPAGTKGLTRAFIHAVDKQMFSFFPFLIPPTIHVIAEVNREYFRVTREGFLKAKLEDVVPKGEDREREWGKVKDTFATWASWYGDDEGGGAKKWLSGSEPSYPDLVLAAICMWIQRVLGEDSVEWKDIKEWNDGIWDRLLKDCRAYEGGC